MEKIIAEFHQGSYPIMIEPDLLSHFSIQERLGGSRDQKWVLITDNKVSLAQQELVQNLKAQAYLSIEIENGERSKSFQQVEKILDKMAEAEVNRYDGLIALGGGVVGDLTGFCASVYMRGIEWVQMPTTLLSQVDSSVGGKTGVNLKAGKNMAGSFYQPSSVWIDPCILKTLSEEQYWAGMAEVIKYAVIEKNGIDQWLENHWESIVLRKPELVSQLIGKCVECKNRIVMKDEREKGLRKILNFGHTAGHAMEKLSDFQLIHGEAVRRGMLFELELAHKLGRIDLQQYQRYKSLVEKIPVIRKAENYQLSELIKGMGSDKKNRDQLISFVLPDHNQVMEEMLLSPAEVNEMMK
ncbi:3-dehydroquinate synthase [Tindallia magadiensis]|uniref:3-dehydroquinate synthase n=1 Tax=Tindallia magadiensis TaxID=69895 RepID=A0A1I3DP11_9FIRM|nr:3-dehydroquinate synthase [Tindallia magadiensis]SFH88319.1 3-dehydroquinate synthase [Tindallia magadiensis]